MLTEALLGRRVYDLSRLKSIDGPRNSELFLRIAFLVPAAALVAYFFDDRIYLEVVAAYIVMLSLHMLVVARANMEVSGGSLAVICATATLAWLVYAYLMAFLWAQSDPLTDVLALILLMAIMMNSVTIRAVEPILKVLDLVMIGATILFIVVWDIRDGGAALRDTVLAGAMILGFIYYTVIARDVARAQRALDKAQAERVQAERLRAVGQLTGGFAHDFNNLLTVVLGNLELQREIADPAERADLIAEAEAAARRGAEMTAQLLAYSRRSTLQPVRVTMTEIVAAVAPLVSRLLPANVTLQLPQTDDLPPLYVDKAKLESALMNLILNARDAMAEGGTIRLSAEVTGPVGAQTVAIAVEDTGVGIPANQIDRVSEPFFSTKPVGKGSGLGLSMAQGFVEQSGGRCELISTPGRGTTVRLYFPAAD